MAAMIACELVLPKSIIQRIQSFLTGKEAARTIILAKSWHSAWLSRPNLRFDESDFPSRNYDNYDEKNTAFLALAKKTLQRYEDSNQNIESFDLCLQTIGDVNYELANILIVKALKLCASHLSFEQKEHEGFVIARQVFESENLVLLSIKGCGIDIGMDFNVRCHKLESLCLTSVELFEIRHVLPKIISSCPLIQNLSLSLMFPINLPKMHNLKCLTLQSVALDSLFFDDFSSKFPSLKYLALGDLIYEHSDDDLHQGAKEMQISSQRSGDNLYQDAKEMQISSRSLERLNLTTSYWVWMFKFDVPRIKKLVIKANWIPLVSFKSTSEEWESHVSLSLRSDKPLNNAWFRELNKLLTALSPSSNINLSINGGCDQGFAYEVDTPDTRGLHKQRVQNLNLDIKSLPSLNCYALFDGLFRICRPKFITHQHQHPDPYSDYSRTNIEDFLSKRLEQGLKGLFLFPENFMYGLNDLKEVHVQIYYDDDVADLPWKPLVEVFEASEIISLEPKQKIRFRLAWK